MFIHETFIKVFTQDRIRRLHDEAETYRHPPAPSPRRRAASLLRQVARRLEPQGGRYVPR